MRSGTGKEVGYTNTAFVAIYKEAVSLMSFGFLMALFPPLFSLFSPRTFQVRSSKMASIDEKMTS